MNPPFLIIDGHNTASVSATDRGLQYGDGVFRTLAIRQGRACFWQQQLARLAEDAARLHFTCPAPDVWLADVAQLSQLTTLSHGSLRLTLTRGSGPRGYAPPQSAQPLRIVQFIPSAPAPMSDEGMALALCELRLATQPRLAGIKHLNRLENVLAKAELHGRAVDDGILLDADDHVIETTSANLILQHGNQLITPRLHRCGVAGVMRDVIAAIAPSLGLSYQEADVPLARLFTADALWACNSLMGLRPVSTLAGHVWPVSSFTLPIQAAIAEKAGLESIDLP